MKKNKYTVTTKRGIFSIEADMMNFYETGIQFHDIPDPNSKWERIPTAFFALEIIEWVEMKGKVTHD